MRGFTPRSARFDTARCAPSSRIPSSSAGPPPPRPGRRSRRGGASSRRASPPCPRRRPSPGPLRSGRSSHPPGAGRATPGSSSAGRLSSRLRRCPPSSLSGARLIRKKGRGRYMRGSRAGRRASHRPLPTATPRPGLSRPCLGEPPARAIAAGLARDRSIYRRAGHARSGAWKRLRPGPLRAPVRGRSARCGHRSAPGQWPSHPGL